MSQHAKTTGCAITGSGVFIPEPVITNEELCEAFNAYVRAENAKYADEIARGEREPLLESSPEFIVKASGIQLRHVWDRTGLLDPERLCPNIPDRRDDEMSYQCEFAVRAATGALEMAGRVGEEVDMVILAASNLQRMYPAIAMEVQDAIGARGFAFDMSVGCSSATYPIQVACDAIRAGNTSCVLLVNPELCTPHMNWRDRDSHFIFGDAGTALVIEPVDRAKNPRAFEILGTRLQSKYSSNIRNNGGYLNRCDPEHQFDDDKLFYQQGRRVFKDIVPLVPTFIRSHLESLGLDVSQVSRFWLHQANLNMDRLIATRLLGREPTPQEMPIVLDKYANTASAGSIIAFHENHDDLPSGALGVICSFGAGYSAGNVVVRRR
ncbi:MAG: beta-ketoacyl-ACP synthase III [Deltaproteobacteria bacterium]|nr:MAG: beta-ketoacyl-ACP synthase III [Deltaproteobacteria bacterium]